MLPRKTLILLNILSCVLAVNAQAALKLTNNGLGVYDTGLDATWTQDANLLGTLEGAYQSVGYNAIITAIINSNGGVIQDTPNFLDGSYRNHLPPNGGPYSGTYTLSASDFGSGGLTDWWGAQAFVHYLNTQHYAGSTQWAMPTTPDTPDSYGYNHANSQFGELYYNQLSGTVGGAIAAGPFSNLQINTYWSGTEYAAIPASAWFFFFNSIPNNANSGYQTSTYKDAQHFVWAVTPGDVNVVEPLPSAVWLFASALFGMTGFSALRTINLPLRRRFKKQ